jgi:hypothetical protein
MRLVRIKGLLILMSSNQGLSIANDVSTQPEDNNFTFECWFYQTGGSGIQGLFNQGSGGVYAPVNVQTNNGSQIYLAISTNGTSWAYLTATWIL